jgi:phospholipase C
MNMKRPNSIASGLARLAVAASLPVGTTGTVRAQEVVPQPAPTTAIQPYMSSPAPASPLSRAQEVALLRQKIKYVFVIFQENRSFDSYFGTFPGARGFFSQPPSETPGYTQPLMNVDGTMTTIQPFRIGPAQFAADTDDVDHSFARMAAKMDIQKGIPLMDRFALMEEMKWVPAGQKPSLKAKQYGELDMAYEDCDTVPFLWNYASRFTLFDNFFQHTIGPSTPAAINLIAAQTGETQWVKHPETANNTPANAAKGNGEPVVSDNNPLWGSSDDHSGSGMPINPNDKPGGQLNQTYATLPLTLQGGTVKTAVSADRDAANDLADVQQDISAIAARNGETKPWGWYEEGYDHEPTDPPGAPADGSHKSYIAHHNGAQYFGYIANNPTLAANMHGLNDFFEAIQAKSLPQQGGLFYVRGGYQNIGGLKPVDPDPTVQKQFLGDDDHPAYSDAHISEALVARTVNAIARSSYWDQSAIIITYDESEGNYDHVAPRIFANAPDGTSLGSGPRIPLIVISPFAKAHVISHELGDQASVIKFVDTLFNLPPLADLPDELEARVLGEKKLGQSNLGPADDLTPGIGELLTAFDDDRLVGHMPALPADYAEIPDNVVDTLPPYGDKGCSAIGMVPVDIATGINNPIPSDFNPRPATNPTPAP